MHVILFINFPRGYISSLYISVFIFLFSTARHGATAAQPQGEDDMKYSSDPWAPAPAAKCGHTTYWLWLHRGHTVEPLKFIHFCVSASAVTEATDVASTSSDMASSSSVMSNLCRLLSSSANDDSNGRFTPQALREKLGMITRRRLAPISQFQLVSVESEGRGRLLMGLMLEMGGRSFSSKNGG